MVQEVDGIGEKYPDNPSQKETSGTPIKPPLDLSFDPLERIGLTNSQAEELYKKWGYNELPEVTISVFYVLFLQFTGTMPYMLELAAIISIAVLDFADFAIIVAMLLCNAFLGFHEQMNLDFQNIKI